MLDRVCQRVDFVNLRPLPCLALTMDAVRAGIVMVSLAQGHCEPVAGPLSHSLTFSQVVHLGWCWSITKMPAQVATQLGHSPKVLALGCCGHSPNPSNIDSITSVLAPASKCFQSVLPACSVRKNAIMSSCTWRMSLSSSFA